MKQRQAAERPVSRAVADHQGRGDRRSDHVAVGQPRDLGQAGRAARREQRGDPIRLGRIRCAGAPGHVGFEHLAVEGNGAVERHRHDPQAGCFLVESGNRLVKPARQAGGRRQQQFRARGLQLDGNRRAREEKIKRMRACRCRGRPHRNEHGGTGRHENRNGIFRADAGIAEPVRRRVKQAHESIIVDRHRLRIVGCAQIG